jgi:heme-degrading monooxygenase HmoA
MVFTVIKHTVENFEHWKALFDADAGRRDAAGARLHSLAREVTNPNTVVVIVQWESASQAQAFMNSPALRETMAKAGVIGVPEVSLLAPVQ